MINVEKELLPEDLILLRDRSKNTELKKRNVELVLKAKKNNIEARNYLYLLNYPNIVNIITKKMNINYTEVEEYVSDCFEYFLEAIESFDNKKNDNFLAWLQTKIVTRMLNKLGNKKNNRIKKNTHSYDNITSEIDFDKHLCRDDSKYDDIGKALTDEEEFVRKQHYEYKEPLSEIAKKTNSDYAKIRDIKKRIIKKLKHDEVSGIKQITFRFF